LGNLDSSSSNKVRFFNVKIGEIFVAKAPAILKTTLGSCVAVILFDKVNKVGGMVHIMFPDSKGDKVDSPGKFADLGIPLLIKKTIEGGAERKNIEVFIVGGNYLTENRGDGKVAFDVGKANLEAVRMVLKKENLPFKEYNVQQNTGTIAIFDVSKGELVVKYLEKFKKANITFQKANIISYDDFVGIVRDGVIQSFKSISSSLNPLLIATEGNYNAAISINIFGNLKGKLLLYTNKSYIYSMFGNNTINKTPSDSDYIESLRRGGEKILKPIIKSLSTEFTNKNVNVKFTEPTIFTLTSYISVNMNYPESWSVNFRINEHIIKITLAIGKVEES